MKVHHACLFLIRGLLSCGLLLAALAGRAQNLSTIQFTPSGNLASGAQILPAPGGWLVKNAV